MLFRSRRRDPAPPPPRVPHPRQSWENAATQIFPTITPGRAGNLTPAQRWRAGGWRPACRPTNRATVARDNAAMRGDAGPAGGTGR
ncbi:hypothetical protein GA0074695_5071 [Micromonospora viridifaciens]|uniref:Uncharacterized protein n=1 Tax=Micromonospora viridifaciens TaxID=1881 RepID=A0A1C4Z4W8_MICVI|nr:hypothetical protein [Micromonospora viridifaciens]SCF27631.1 hypothetical protein GA0074695_5071 [Micromonospora viridifaciens]